MQDKQQNFDSVDILNIYLKKTKGDFEEAARALEAINTIQRTNDNLITVLYPQINK